jgi:hypothetical protein
MSTSTYLPSLQVCVIVLLSFYHNLLLYSCLFITIFYSIHVFYSSASTLFMSFVANILLDSCIFMLIFINNIYTYIHIYI